MSTDVARGRGLDREGIHSDRIRWNLSTGALYEEAVLRREGAIAAEGKGTVVTYHHGAGHKVAMPEELRRRIEALEATR